MTQKLGYQLLLLFIIASLFTCNKDNEQLKDSYESYRYELWKRLVDNGWQFDFVGTQEDEGDYERYEGQNFDIDHQGIERIQTEGILENLEEVLQRIEQPNVVLLGVGESDFVYGRVDVGEVINNVNQIIDVLQSNLDSVIIFLEQIAPARIDIMSLNPDLVTKLDSFNNAIPILASQQTDGTGTVLPVNMNIDWRDSYLADEVHYNELGARIVASRYYSALKHNLSPDSTYVILPLGDSRVQGNRP